MRFIYDKDFYSQKWPRIWDKDRYKFQKIKNGKLDKKAKKVTIENSKILENIENINPFQESRQFFLECSLRK